MSLRVCAEHISCIAQRDLNMAAAAASPAAAAAAAAAETCIHGYN